jgi:Tol biopolymer transport system component
MRSTLILALCFLLLMACGAAAQFTLPQVQVALVDMEGKRTPVGQLPISVFAPRVSPDGKEVLYDDQLDGQLWVAKLSDFASKRRVGNGNSRGPYWSIDGKHIFYITDYEREEALFWRAADGTGTPEFLSKPVRAPESRSPQNILSFITLGSAGDYDIWTLNLTTKERTTFYGVTGSAQHSSHFSPDGKWIAYASAESGRLEVYVRSFPPSTPPVQVSRNGGEHPLWSPDQKTLYFDVNRRMYAAAITTSPTGTASAPKELPIQGFVQGPLRRQYDLTPDGKQFLMMFQ